MHNPIPSINHNPSSRIRNVTISDPDHPIRRGTLESLLVVETFRFEFTLDLFLEPLDNLVHRNDPDGHTDLSISFRVHGYVDDKSLPRFRSSIQIP